MAVDALGFETEVPKTPSQAPVEEHTPTITPSGEMDYYTTPGIKEEILLQIENDQTVVIDFREVTFVDATFLAILTDFYRNGPLDEDGKSAVLETQNMTRYVLEVSRNYGFDKRFKHTETQDWLESVQRESKKAKAAGHLALVVNNEVKTEEELPGADPQKVAQELYEIHSQRSAEDYIVFLLPGSRGLLGRDVSINEV